MSRLKRWADRFSDTSQLHLILSDLDTLPPAELPDGHHCRTVAMARDLDYVRVMQRSLLESADAQWFRETFSDDPDYDPENLLIIFVDEQPIAATAAWQAEWDGRPVGLIHMVGVDREHRGQGLGRLILLLALHRLKERGFHKVLLRTEDSRIPALRLYLSLGFEPVVLNARHEARWREILSDVREPS